MSLKSKIVAWVAFLVLCPLIGTGASPLAAAEAVTGVNDGLGQSWSSTMYLPELLSFNVPEYGFFNDNGVEAGEPVTPGSGSICDESDPWTLDSTDWYYFYGTGGRLVIRLAGDSIFGMVLYATGGVPTVEDGLACVRQDPRRLELDTEAGQRYLIQVGDWDKSFKPSEDYTYRLNVATPSANSNRAHAVDLPFNSTVSVDNFGSPFDEVAPECGSEEGESVFLGGRPAWAKIETGLAGTVHLSATPVEVLSSDLMIAAYAAGSDTPIACSIGPFAIRDLVSDLEFEVGPGTYWLEVMPAEPVSWFLGISPEERWELSASFIPDLDVDNDGHARPSDCDDTDPSVHPGAVDLPDDGVDQNCDGADAKRDGDGDGIPDYRDRCPSQSNGGIDSDGDGCRDPQLLPLVAQIRMTLTEGRLHVVSLLVRTDAGANLALSCDNAACRSEKRRSSGKRTQLRGIFSRFIPNGTEVKIAASKSGHIGISKRYHLSPSGVSLVGQRCKEPGKKGRVVPCG